LKFGGGNLFSPAMTSTIEGNNSVGSLLEPLLKKVTPVVGSRMLCVQVKEADSTPEKNSMKTYVTALAVLQRDAGVNVNKQTKKISSTRA
jgi:hypothetical protein